MNKFFQIFFTVFIIQFFFTSRVNSQSVIFSENFDSVNSLWSNGWQQINKSNPVGAGQWIQGNGDVGESAFSGADTSYAQVDYSSTNSIGTISNWLLTPSISLLNNDTISFYTLSYQSSAFPDNLECRLSTNGASDTVGSNDTTVGNFSTLLFAINPQLDSVSYPSHISVGGTQTWRKYSAVISGLSSITLCRIGLRYFVTNGGAAGNNSSTIGVDNFKIMRNTFAGIAENNFNTTLHVFPNPAKENIAISISKKGNYLVNVINTLGENVITIKSETSQTIDISMLSNSIYNIEVIDLTNGEHRNLKFVKE